MEIVNFPYSASRRVMSRRPRRSKNGTPEERAAKAAAGRPDPSTAPNVVEISRRSVERNTPCNPEESAYFRAALAQLHPSELARVAAMVERLLEEPSRAKDHMTTTPGASVRTFGARVLSYDYCF
jgi:hypothetical protein